MPTRWYALRSKPRKEEVLFRQVHAHGIEVYYPRLRVQPVNPRSKKFKPYFPGYMFVNVDLEKMGRSTLQWMPHSVGLVSFGGEPAHVPENLIYALQKRVDEINEAGGEIFDGLKPGDPIRISEGPFAGYAAIFNARIPGSERVRVLIRMLSDRQLPVELQASQIKSKNKS